MKIKNVLFIAMVATGFLLSVQHGDIGQSQMPLVEIYIKGLKLDFSMEISSDATIKNVKERIFQLEGISTKQQILCIIAKKWRSLGFSETISNPLCDDQSIKRVIREYNSNVFQVSLKNKDTE